MAKTHYNKIEEAIEKELHDMKVKGLLKQADAAQGKEVQEGQTELTPKQIMTLVEQDLKFLLKRDKSVYKSLKLKRKIVEDLLKRAYQPDPPLEEKEITEIKQLREKVSAYKKEKFPPKSEEEQLEEEASKHIYKRHNTKSEWLPLDTHAQWNKFKKKR